MGVAWRRGGWLNGMAFGGASGTVGKEWLRMVASERAWGGVELWTAFGAAGEWVYGERRDGGAGVDTGFGWNGGEM